MEAVSKTFDVLKTSEVLECSKVITQERATDYHPLLLDSGEPKLCSTAIKLRKEAPSPAGEGWGEENKIKRLPPLIPAFSLKGEGAKSLNLMAVPYQNDEAFPDRQTLEPITHSTRPDLVDKTSEETQTCEVFKTSQVLERSKVITQERATDYHPLLLDSAETPLSAASTTYANNEMESLFLQGINTQFGGIFYLLNVALALELYGDFTQPRAAGIALSPWDWLALIGRAWFGSTFEQDPVWRLLAELAGRSFRQTPDCDFLPPESWTMPIDWFLPWGDVDVLNVYVQRNRLQLWHTAGFVIMDMERDTENTPLIQARNLCLQHENLGEVRLVRVYRQLQKTNSRSKLKRWLNWQLLYLHARLKRALHDDTPDALAKLVCCHTATLYCTATTLDVYLSLDTLPIELRIAGLDRNPGWIPTASLSIAFHFQ
jgi:hypothetical protein